MWEVFPYCQKDSSIVRSVSIFPGRLQQTKIYLSIIKSRQFQKYKKYSSTRSTISAQHDLLYDTKLFFQHVRKWEVF